MPNVYAGDSPAPGRNLPANGESPPDEASPRQATEGIAENAGERLTEIVPAPEAAREDATLARCRRCHAPLSRPESVAAQLGPVCRHAVDLDELEGVGG